MKIDLYPARQMILTEYGNRMANQSRVAVTQVRLFIAQSQRNPRSLRLTYYLWGREGAIQVWDATSINLVHNLQT